MTISVNGNAETFSVSNPPLADLLSRWRVDNPERVVCTVNGRTVSREAFSSYLLSAGDEVVLSYFVSGG
jgi:thiamine biosynthesis protein ThiS